MRRRAHVKTLTTIDRCDGRRREFGGCAFEAIAPSRRLDRAHRVACGSEPCERSGLSGHGRRRRSRRQGAASQADREVQRLRSPDPGELVAREGDRLAEGRGPRDRRLQGQVGALQGLPLAAEDPCQGRTGSRHRRRWGAQHHPARRIDRNTSRRRRGSLVEAHRKARPRRSARLPPAGRGHHRRKRRGQGGDSRLPRRCASLRRFWIRRHLHHARPGERDRRLRAAVHQHAAGRVARRQSGRGRGSDLQLRRSTQAGARLLRPSQRDALRRARGLRRQRRGRAAQGARRAGRVRFAGGRGKGRS